MAQVPTAKPVSPRPNDAPVCPATSAASDDDDMGVPDDDGDDDDDDDDDGSVMERRKGSSPSRLFVPEVMRKGGAHVVEAEGCYGREGGDGAAASSRRELGMFAFR
jgi:hypothetical protein